MKRNGVTRDGATPTKTFRLPDESLRELEDLARDTAATRGGRINRTAAIIEAIRQAHVQRFGDRRKKSEKPS